MYEIVIICVNVVVYAVCKGGRQFTPSPINIKGVGFAKVSGVFYETDVYRVQTDFAKVQKFYMKAT